MKKEIGLWIDYHHAVIVILTMKSEIVRRVESVVGQSKSITAGANVNSLPAEIIRQQSASQLEDYFKRVIANIQESKSIFIFGPGEAKNDLEKQMERADLDQQIVDIESAEEMSDRQILAKVHRYFPNNRRSIFQAEEIPIDHKEM
jgi:stalled ribosome rescue protein Dom34